MKKTIIPGVQTLCDVEVSLLEELPDQKHGGRGSVSSHVILNAKHGFLIPGQ